ncbi:MAG: electron transfer flavoprotein subunit alpha/FixB family protein, partial [Alphaproteobacteria bacterium]|nr:electron transfer flavoprotein subunit alpha/FixB family protein [Alphaproteobacteria bacterium]
MNKILIVAEHDGTRLNPAIAKCVRCARDVPDANVTVLVLAADPAAVAADAAAITGVDAVVTVTNAANA